MEEIILRAKRGDTKLSIPVEHITEKRTIEELIDVNNIKYYQGYNFNGLIENGKKVYELSEEFEIKTLK